MSEAEHQANWRTMLGMAGRGPLPENERWTDAQRRWHARDQGGPNNAGVNFTFSSKALPTRKRK